VKKLKIKKETLLPLEVRQLDGVAAGGAPSQVIHQENTLFLHVAV